MGGGKGTSKSSSAPPKEIMEAYRKSIGYAGQAISKPYEQYQGQLVAGLNPTQQQGIANVNAAQGVALPFIQQGAQYTNQAAQGVNPQMINQFMSPYLNTVVGATQRNLLESNAQQQNALKSQAIQSGAFGGDRARIGQAELARQQGLAGGQVIGGLMNQGFGQALAGAQQNVQNMLAGGQQLGAMGQAAQQSILQGAQAQLAAGAQQQATDQAFLQSAYDQFLQRQAFPFQQAQFYANIAQGIGAGAGGTTTQQAAAPNPLSQIFGGLTAIGSIFPSDERLKENIEPIGKTFDGQNIYKYNFKDEPGRKRIGLMAQEVEKKHPEAVKNLGGIKMVDYDEATENAAQRNGKALGGSSMGGLVTPDMQRQAFAQGGFGGVPYADFFKGMAYVPTGELTYRGQSPGSTLPKGFSPEELEKIASGSSFDEINAMSEGDIGNFKAGASKIGTSLGLMPASSGAEGARAPAFSGPLSSFGPGVSNFFSSLRGALPFAEGGVVPRHGYATDGSVDEESPLPPFLVKAESGGDFAADNEMGYVGRGQFGEARLTDAKRAGVLPPDVTLDQFKADPGLQKAVESWHVQDVNNYIQDRGLGAFVGKEINGVPVTPQGLLAVAHLGGKGGMEKFVKSGGRYNPKDANGTSLMDYLALAVGTEGGVIPANNNVVAIPASQNTDVLEPLSSGVVPADLPDMPPAGVAPPPMGDVQAKYSPTGVVPTADETPATSQEPARRRNMIESLIGQDLSDQARTGLLAAGLAMLGGRSPYFGVNVGKGALAGLQAYYTGLTNQRELAKTEAELGLRKYEADTARLQAETAREQMIRTLYTQILPYVQFYQAEGRPIPPEYQAIIDEAMRLGVAKEAPAQGPAPATSAPIETSPTPTAPPVIEGDEAAASAPAPAPAPVAGEPAAPAVPPAASTETPAVSEDPELANPDPVVAKLFAQLPDDQNPYKLYEKAGRAATFDMKKGYIDQARQLLADYKLSGIPLPSGIVIFPGVAEAEAEKKRIGAIGEGEGKSVTAFNDQMSEMQGGFSSRSMVVDGLRDILKTAETGKFGEIQADLYNMAASFGLANADQIKKAADFQTAMKLFAQGVLDSGMKDKIGPQISNADLMLVGRAQGNPENLPLANRNIIGAMYGKLLFDRAKVEAWDEFIEEQGGIDKITTSERRKWEREFGSDNNVMKFVEMGKSMTPVAGEIKSDKPPLPSYYKKGWQYVDPKTGRIFVVKDFQETNGKKMPVLEFVN